MDEGTSMVETGLTKGVVSSAESATKITGIERAPEGKSLRQIQYEQGVSNERLAKQPVNLVELQNMTQQEREQLETRIKQQQWAETGVVRGEAQAGQSLKEYLKEENQPEQPWVEIVEEGPEPVGRKKTLSFGPGEAVEGNFRESSGAGNTGKTPGEKGLGGITDHPGQIAEVGLGVAAAADALEEAANAISRAERKRGTRTKPEENYDAGEEENNPSWRGKDWSQMSADLRALVAKGYSEGDRGATRVLSAKKKIVEAANRDGYISNAFLRARELIGAITIQEFSDEGIVDAWNKLNAVIVNINPFAQETEAVDKWSQEKMRSEYLRVYGGMHDAYHQYLSDELRLALMRAEQNLGLQVPDDQDITELQRKQGIMRFGPIPSGIETIAGAYAGLEKKWLDEKTATVPAPTPGGDGTKDIFERLFGGSGYADFVNRIWQQDAAQTDWVNRPPEWYSKLDDKEKSRVRMMEKLARASAIKVRYGNRPDLVKNVKDNEILLEGLKTSEIKNFYEAAGGRESLQLFAQKYFSFDWVDNRPWVKFRDDDTIKELCDPEKFLASREEMTARISTLPSVIEEAKRFNVDPIVHAKGKIASAWNLFYVSHVIESADRDYKMPPGAEVYGEAIRAEFHPLSKLRKKLKMGKFEGGDQEAWGGGVGDWFAERGVTHPEIVNSITSEDRPKQGEMRPFPKTLFASMLELTSDGPWDPKRYPNAKGNIIEALISGRPIKWGSDKLPPNWWGAYADKWSGASAIYEYATGADKRKVGKTHVEWKMWGNDLHNAYVKLSETGLERYMNDEGALFWIMLNCLGVNPYKENLDVIGFPHLDITVKQMIGETLKYVYVWDGKQNRGERKYVKNLAKNISGYMRAGYWRSLTAGLIGGR